MLADPHARERSFGRHSVLDMPFAAAVKTGTSSDFRDTWTVGFTRDYTVGVWVGNFDGSAMRGISGVTGAGPLWNRIMLHLHERKEPEPLPPPSGFVATAICATTGHAPQRGCPAVVREWVRPADLADVRRPVAPQLGHEYDAWLALHPPRSRRSASHRVSARRRRLRQKSRGEFAAGRRAADRARAAGGRRRRSLERRRRRSPPIPKASHFCRCS